MTQFDTDHLKLTDFLDLPTLQEIQDSFAAVANVKVTIADAQGQTLTQATPTTEFLKRQRAIADATSAADAAQGPQRSGGEYVAPIMVNNQRLGTIRMTAQGGVAGIDDAKLAQLAEKVGIDLKPMRQIAAQLLKSRAAKPAAIQFLYLLANAVARLCFQEFQLRQRINELTAVYNVAMMLADARNVDTVLQRTVELVADVMQTKASSIRLVDADRDELVIKAVHNLSGQYINKGPIRLSKAQIDHEALAGKGYEYVRNLAEDPRSLYPGEARLEGIASMLSVGMRYKGRAIGVLRVYTDKEQAFSPLQIDLMKAIAAQAAAAIENARLLQESIQVQALERQVQMAAQVQHRMIPQKPPTLAGVDLASVYIPSQELGGDFYDFIELPYDNIGLVVADVSGKGIPASLTMAAVRAALRAQVDNVYYLYEVIRRINLMVFRDSSAGEFVTLFYGVLDGRNRRFTYCNAGHPPGLILRDGKIIELGSDNMVLGVNPEEKYTQSLVDLRIGDTLMLYTDGLPDAMNFQRQTFGRQRVLEAFAQGGATAVAVAENVVWNMRRYAGLTARSDDVTMIVAKIS
ncbi:MAG: SpoIIE family protein phosphatase [Tepidisphaeraceae bacterium]|jgi:sigma-B regulation protein RsbU (phosphoserine phosphatase)